MAGRRSSIRRISEKTMSPDLGGIAMARLRMNILTSAALAIAASLMTAGAAWPQAKPPEPAKIEPANPPEAPPAEVKPAPKYGNMSTVTQDLLNRAENDGNNFLL